MTAGKVWYQLNREEAVKELSSDPNKGLSPIEAKERLTRYGTNELKHKEGPTIIEMFLGQFKEFLVLILIAASIVSALVGERTDAIVIMGIVLINAALGVFQEFRASKAMEALKRMASPHAKVIRDGSRQTIPASELVIGDVVLIETGDYIPADMRLLETINLKVEEAALTGESVPVEKHGDVTFKDEIGLGDQVNMGFMSTIVTYGRGKGLVTGTGINTVIGNIAEMIQSVTEESTPLQRRLAEFGKYLGIACLVICAAVFVIGLLRGEALIFMFMTAVSLAVAAIPEGLPAVVTIVLALGMQRMVKHNAIIKKLHAVETLGSTTVICSDKTGTLTQNQMMAVQMYTAGQVYDISGEGYSSHGEVTLNGEKVNLEQDKAVTRLLHIATLCNDARLNLDRSGGEENCRILGDPTEGALIVAAAKTGLTAENLNSCYPRVQEIPFDSKRKLMTTFHQSDDGVVYAYTKGAPDILVSLCDRMLQPDGTVTSLTPADKEAILDNNRAMAAKALRVLALAYKTVDGTPANPNPEEIERDLIFSGLVGMIDPPRPEAVEAVKVCKTAGIRVVMITGDYKDTAAAIAGDLGITGRDNPVLTGTDLNKLDEESMRQAAANVNVFARVSPEHKVGIVRALKENGEIVAMTGDGVNDAPALKRADIGIAMGITGTDVTKETADMVITDDNFASIVAAVEEGRVIYSNIRKFVFFLLSCNMAEIMIIFLAIILGWPIPLLPIHLLWINLITDAFPALALGIEKKEPNIMDVPPRNPSEPIINRDMRVSILIQSSILTLTVLASFYIAFSQYNDVNIARTYAFATLVIAELLRVYTVRSERYTLWRIGIFTNPALNLATLASLAMLVVIMIVPVLADLFSLEKLSMTDWQTVAALSILPFLSGEISKVFKKS